MKRLSLLTILLCFVIAAKAQPTTRPQTSAEVGETPIAAGNWLVGGSIGSTGFNFSTETFQINLNPQAGYFVQDNLAIGAQINLGLSAYDGGSTVFYGLSPFVRYYFPRGSTTTNKWFGEGNVGISGSAVKNSQQDEPVSLLLGVRAGYAHFVTSTVAIEGTLGYTYTKADISGDSDGSSGLGLGVGFQIYLPGRRK